MKEQDIEQLLNSTVKPRPREETTRRIMDEALKTTSVRVIHGRAFWQHPRAIAAGFVALFALAGIIVTLSMQPHDTVLAGKLHVSRQGKPIVLRQGDRIRRGDMTMTRDKISCQLKDGTFLKLDRDTRLTFVAPNRGERARLQLKQGRIFLRVAKARGKLMVSGSTGDVEVLGTIFGAEDKKDALAVSVFKGRVALRSATGALELSNGQSGAAITTKQPVLTDIDPNLALLWARDDTEFDRRPLGDVLDWIEANSSYEFDVPASLRSERITITIAADPMPDVIEILFLTCGVEYTVTGNNVLVLAKGH